MLGYYRANREIIPVCRVWNNDHDTRVAELKAFCGEGSFRVLSVGPSAHKMEIYLTIVGWVTVYPGDYYLKDKLGGIHRVTQQFVDDYLELVFANDTPPRALPRVAAGVVNTCVLLDADGNEMGRFTVADGGTPLVPSEATTLTIQLYVTRD